MHVAVVGSGPAGYFCAKALAERGIRVTILDVGKELDRERRDKADMLANTRRERWQPTTMHFLSRNPMIAEKGVPRKLLFGSDFAYQFTHPFSEIKNQSSFPAPTFAKGGYSMMWGGAALPACDCDIDDWPFNRSDLIPFYKRVLKTLPLCGGAGNLNEAFPEFSDNLGQLPMGIQGRRLIADLKKSEEWLKIRGILYGAARLAIQTQASEYSLGCNHCGFCLSGCPRDAIFNTSSPVDSLATSETVVYRKNVIVKSVLESVDTVELLSLDEATGEKNKEYFDAVFLAAGVINTTRILLESKQLFNVPVTLKESQKFLMPLFRLDGDAEVLTEKRVTLANLFIEARLSEISDHWIHMQISPMNDMIMKAMGVDPWAPKSFRKQLLSPLLKRMMVAWCGLHSDHGDTIDVRLESGEANRQSILHIQGHQNLEGRRLVWRVARRFFKLGLHTKSFFLPYPMFSEPGRATHCGGSFPMRKNPKTQFDSDIFGRPFGWKRVYTVDSTGFPSIPGTTIGLNIMANAYRVGSTAPLRRI